MKRLIKLSLIAIIMVACSKTAEEAEVAVTSVTLSQTAAEMIIGETVQLNATVLPSNATDKTVLWASSKTSVATVTRNGLVTAVAEGSATITASSGGESDICIVTVSKGVIAVTSISINKTSIKLVEGDSKTLTAFVKPDDATDKTVTWSSSNEDIAKVEYGTITAIKEGTATITAKAGDKSATCSVTVTKKVIAVTSVELNKTYLELDEGASETLTATVRPDDATDKTVKWSSSDESIAIVEDGNVTAVKAGEAIISARSGDCTSTCNVKVWNPNNIKFADENLKEKLVAAFDKDEDGELSYAEAANVSTSQEILDAVNGVKSFKSFDEFQYFASITRIVDNMFQGWSIQSIVLPKGIDIIGEWAFDSCSNLESVSLNEGLKNIKKAAFRYCQKLTNITMPQSLQGIGAGAFYHCSSLKTIEIPNSCVGVSTFAGCTSLESVICRNDNVVGSIDMNAFSGCKSLEYINISLNTSIIWDNAFNGCSSLKTPLILRGVYEINQYAFKNCSSLTSIDIVVNYGEHDTGGFDSSSFYGCNGLETVTIDAKRIPSEAFYECINLKSLSLSDRIKSIGGSAFIRCKSLTSIIVKATTPPSVGADAFKETNNCPIYVPAESVEAYKAAEKWKDYADRIQAIP